MSRISFPQTKSCGKIFQRLQIFSRNRHKINDEKAEITTQRSNKVHLRISLGSKKKVLFFGLKKKKKYLKLEDMRSGKSLSTFWKSQGKMWKAIPTKERPSEICEKRMRCIIYNVQNGASNSSVCLFLTLSLFFSGGHEKLI